MRKRIKKTTFFKMKKSLKSFHNLLATSLLLTTSFCYADYLQPVSVENVTPNHWYITLGAGATWFVKPRAYTTSTAPPFDGTDVYRYEKNKLKPVLLLGGGYEWQRKTKFWLPSYSIGLRYSYYFSNKQKGTYQFMTAEPSEFNYKTQSQALLAVGKLSLLKWHNIMPYVIGGVGFARNHFLSYQDAPPPKFPDNYHIFPNKASFSFAYLAGLGVEYQIKGNWRLGLEYHYTHLGNGKSGENKNKKTIPVPLAEQSILLKISYYFA